MEVVLIKFVWRYDDDEQIMGIAINMDAANEYVKEMKMKYPHAYGDDCGKFEFEEFEVIGSTVE